MNRSKARDLGIIWSVYGFQGIAVQQKVNQRVTVNARLIYGNSTLCVDVLAWGKDKDREGPEKGEEGKKAVEREMEGQK